MRKINKYLIVFSIIFLIPFYTFICNCQIPELNSDTQKLINEYLVQAEKYEKENNKIETVIF